MAGGGGGETKKINKWGRLPKKGDFKSLLI